MFTALLAFDEVQQAIDVVNEALVLTVKLATPILVVGLAIGLIFAIFQTATSIQEQTLAFIPKMFAVAILLILIFPWMAMSLLEYTINLWEVQMPIFQTQGFGESMPPIPAGGG